MNMMYRLLDDRCNEIKAEGVNGKKTEMIIDAFYKIIECANVAREEGLLALEEMAESLDKTERTQELFASQLAMIVDGTEHALVIDMGINELISSGLKSYEGLIALMYLRGCIMIQAGDTPRVIEMMIRSLLPDCVRKELLSEAGECDMSAVMKTAEDKIANLCEDNAEIDKSNHSLINQTAITIVSLTDMAIRRLLREVDNDDIAFMMKALPGKARRRVFDNMSQRLGELIADDMEYMGPVRLRDVEEVCAKVMKKLMKLIDMCEIDFDASILKVVLDIYENAEEKNKKLREEYRELKAIIDNIYR